MRIDEPVSAVKAYFQAMKAALTGLKTLAATAAGDLPGEAMGAVILPCLHRLIASFSAWESRIGFIEQFRIARAESGFPVFQSVLELDRDRESARERLATIPDAAAIRAEMADFILRNRAFPGALQSRMAERLYLERLEKADVFGPFTLPETVHLSVNPDNRRPAYHVTWAAYDGVQNLPMVYMARIEDSTEKLGRLLVTADGRLNPDVPVPLPVGGLLNPELARAFDAFVMANSAYALTPSTIATNMDRDFPDLHPKKLSRLVLGPFYASGITENNPVITDILSKVRRTENAWAITWTVQDILSVSERPEQRGFFSSTPAMQEFHVETGDLEAARMGVSAYQKHALVPHDAYQALYAAGEAERLFDGFRVHVISGDNIISEV